ncbi:MAG: hypothetical protein NZZ41_02375 [Candidatus Dojkabacteria bacterium]|nr:hypothetical protein [Candidatus Dojkabacteria bacterium]
MPVINKTYTINNTTDFPITKTAEVLVDGVVKPSTVTETPTSLSITANIPDHEVTEDLVVRVRITTNIGTSCTKEYIDILPELLNELFVSFHFRGAAKSLVFESNSRLNYPEFHNVFNSCVGIQYQLAPGTGISNWDSYTQLTLSQLTHQLATLPTPYSLRVTVQDYAQGSDCGICLKYKSIAVPENFQYNFDDIARDVIIYFDGSAKYHFVSAGSNNGSTFNYNLIVNNDVNNFIYGNISTLSSLNSAISAVPVNQPYAVQVWVNYPIGVNSAIGTFVLNKI